jgi:predicted 2-oxoglutarate/Fe(II)-dependent dioxygenase YbiX
MSCVESLDCSGAAGDKLARLIDDGVLTRHEEYLEVANEAAYLPGRLAMFLPETPHAVTPLLRGTRSILFMWFNCVPFTKPPQRYDQVQPAIERAAAKKKKMGASMNG